MGSLKFDVCMWWDHYEVPIYYGCPHVGRTDRIGRELDASRKLKTSHS